MLADGLSAGTACTCTALYVLFEHHKAVNGEKLLAVLAEVDGLDVPSALRSCSSLLAARKAAGSA